MLYAPTRRDYVRGGLVDRIDLARFADDLGEGHTLLVRLHPSLTDGPSRGMGLSELHRRGVVLDATDEPHVEDLMLASDVLVTDYSALMFDYANLDRPIVIHADDWGAYAASRARISTSRPTRRAMWPTPTGSWRGCSRPGPGGTRSRRGCGPGSGRGSARSTTGGAAERVVRTLMLGERVEHPVPVAVVPAQAGHDVLTSSRAPS